MEQYFSQLDDNCIRLLWDDFIVLSLSEKVELTNQLIKRGMISEEELNPSGHVYYELYKLKVKEINYE